MTQPAKQAALAAVTRMYERLKDIDGMYSWDETYSSIRIALTAEQATAGDDVTEAFYTLKGAFETYEEHLNYSLYDNEWHILENALRIRIITPKADAGEVKAELTNVSKEQYHAGDM